MLDRQRHAKHLCPTRDSGGKPAARAGRRTPQGADDQAASNGAVSPSTDAGHDGLVAPRLVGANFRGRERINAAGWKPALQESATHGRCRWAASRPEVDPTLELRGWGTRRWCA